jgi:hypothetical protein
VQPDPSIQAVGHAVSHTSKCIVTQMSERGGIRITRMYFHIMSAQSGQKAARYDAAECNKIWYLGPKLRKPSSAVESISFSS